VHLIEPVNKIALTSNKKSGVKRLLKGLIETSFFDQERSMSQILEQLKTTGRDLSTTQVSGILLALFKEHKLRRYPSPLTHRYVYIKTAD